MTRAVIFDLDDTLYPEWQYAFSGFHAVAEACAELLGNPDDVSDRMKRIFRSGDTSRVFNTLLNELNIPQVDTLISRMIQVFRTHAPTIALRPDADQLLARLRGAGMATGLITDGYAVAQHAKIDALNLRERIDVIIVTDDWGREFWKPHPRAFLEMADRLGVDHGACVYVGDNPSKDFVAPNQLGWDTVMVRRDEAVHAAVETADGGSPRRVIGDLSSF